MPLTYSQALPAPGDDIDADILAALFNDVKAKFGNIVGADIDPNAGIPGGAIAAASMPGDRIAPKTVAQSQLGLLAVGTPEIIDLAVTKAKVTTTVGSQLIKANLAITTQTVNFNTILGGASVTLGPTTPVPVASFDILSVSLNFTVPVNGCTVTVERGTLAGNHVLVFRAYGPGGSISGAADMTYIAKS